MMKQTNQLKVHTRPLPAEGTPAESAEIARALLLCYRDGQFTCQTFFTQPLIGQINWLEGLKRDAHVYFREITAIGIDLFHIRLVGKEEDVRKMCGAPSFYDLLRGIEATLTEDTRSRWYLDIASGKEHWDAIVDVPRKAFHVANHVNVRKTRTRIDNILVVGDRLLGLTGTREVVIGKLTPDVIERENVMLDMEPMENVNNLGKIDALARLPNSDEVFLVTVQNRVYHFDLWGTMTSFEELPESVKQINSVEFNRVCSVLATTEGLFEVDVREMPNMVRATGLPRQIVHPQLREDFTVARYVEDPLVLGIHPAMAILAKTKDDKVCVC
jgi:hypothetical protein